MKRDGKQLDLPPQLESPALWPSGLLGLSAPGSSLTLVVPDAPEKGWGEAGNFFGFAGIFGGGAAPEEF